MKATRMPPSDKRVSQMNDVQWLWSYLNIQKDEEEEEDVWTARLDFLAFFINPEAAKKVIEHRNMIKGNKKSNFSQEAVYANTEFEKEIIASRFGYDPSCGLTVDEFLQQYRENKIKPSGDIMNDSFDDLLSGGEFEEIPDTSLEAGNAHESMDEFLFRAMNVKEFVDLENKKNNSDLNNPEIKKALYENGFTEDDLDIFDVGGEE